MLGFNCRKLVAQVVYLSNLYMRWASRVLSTGNKVAVEEELVDDLARIQFDPFNGQILAILLDFFAENFWR